MHNRYLNEKYLILSQLYQLLNRVRLWKSMKVFFPPQIYSIISERRIRVIYYKMSFTLIQHPSDLCLFHALVLTVYMEVVLGFCCFLRVYQYNLRLEYMSSLNSKKNSESRLVQKNKDVSKDDSWVKVVSLTWHCCLIWLSSVILMTRFKIPLWTCLIYSVCNGKHHGVNG